MGKRIGREAGLREEEPISILPSFTISPKTTDSLKAIRGVFNLRRFPLKFPARYFRFRSVSCSFLYDFLLILDGNCQKEEGNTAKSESLVCKETTSIYFSNLTSSGFSLLREMFVGNDNTSSGNPSFPSFIHQHHFQYEGSNASQLQLFGTLLPEISVNPVNYGINDHVSPLLLSTKRRRNSDDISEKQMLQISLNNFPLGENNMPSRVADPNAVSTGLRLFHDDEEHNSSVTSAGASMPELPTLTSLADNMRTQIDSQMEEFDHLFRVQTEQLAKGLREMNRRHTASLLSSIEKNARKRLREKEVEIEDMNRRNNDLTARIHHLSAEAQSWHYRARNNESLVNTLRSNLSKVTTLAADQIVEGRGENKVDDATSSCSPVINFTGTPGKESKVLNRHTICKVCRSKEACMLIMNCRHLSLCEHCERFVNVCPTCRVDKNSVIRVYMS